MPIKKLSPQFEAQNLILLQNIQEPPINVESIATERFGINIGKSSLPDQISAFLSIDEQGNASIFVNSDHGERRQRFSIAHELGHFVLHKNTGIHIDKYSYFTRRSDFSEKATDIKEVEANRFAAELLMPKHLVARKIEELGIIDFIDNDNDELIGELANTFNVSQMAMSLRLQNLGLCL